MHGLQQAAEDTILAMMGGVGVSAVGTSIVEGTLQFDSRSMRSQLAQTPAASRGHRALSPAVAMCSKGRSFAGTPAGRATDLLRRLVLVEALVVVKDKHLLRIVLVVVLATMVVTENTLSRRFVSVEVLAKIVVTENNPLRMLVLVEGLALIMVLLRIFVLVVVLMTIMAKGTPSRRGLYW